MKKDFYEESLVFKHKINKFNTKITKSYACILKVFVATIDLPINILISFGICSTPELSK